MKAIESWRALTWRGKLFVSAAAVGIGYMVICTIIITIFVLAIAW